MSEATTPGASAASRRDRPRAARRGVARLLEPLRHRGIESPLLPLHLLVQALAMGAASLLLLHAVGGLPADLVAVVRPLKEYIVQMVGEDRFEELRVVHVSSDRIEGRWRIHLGPGLARFDVVEHRIDLCRDA